MGDNVFQPPPVPPVHVGGRQPYAAAVRFVPGSSVDNPTPDLDTDTNARVIAQAWQVDPWPYVFLGSAQPYGKGCLNNAIKPGWSIDNPPGFINDYIIDPLDPLPASLPRKLNPALMSTTAVVQPPFSLGWLPNVLTSWQSPDPLPQQKRPAQIVSVDNPQPDADTEANMYTILRQWQPPDPAPFQKPPTQIVSVDNPPGFRPLIEDRVQIVQAWQPADPFPTQPRYFYVQPGIAVVYVPYNMPWFNGVVASWQPVPPPIEPQHKLSPGIPGQSVDNPSGFVNDYIADPIDPLPPQLGMRFVVQPGVAVVVTYVPPGIPWLAGVLASWQPADPQPQQRRTTQISSVDNPPFEPNADEVNTLSGILVTWQPPDPFPKQPRYTQVVSVDSPQPDSDTDVNLMAVLRTWQPVDPPPTLPRYFYIAPSVVNNPPFVLYGSNNWQVTVRTAWQPGPPQPFQHGPLPIQITAVPVDNPPFAVSGFINMMDAVRAWQPPDPFPKQPRYSVVQPGVVVVYVPYTRPWLVNIVGAWQPPDPQPTQKTPQQTISVDSPPAFNVNDLMAVIQGWQPPDPWPTQRRTTFVPGMSVDAPPRYMGALVDFTQIIATWWKAPDPQPFQKAPTQIISVDQPRPRQMAWFATVVQQWQPPDPFPMVALRHLPVRVTAVPVDFPPPDMRARVLEQIIRDWQPNPWAYSRFYTRGAFIPMTAATIVKHPTLAGTFTVTRLVGIDSAPTLGGTRATPSLKGDP